MGAEVARHAAPSRASGDAVVVHCSSSVWAAELALLERSVRRRLEAALDGPAPRLRFEVGALPEDRSPPEPRAPVRPDAADHEAASELVRGVADPRLRGAAERAIAAGLAAARSR